MAKCKNHSDKSAIYKCSVCNASICFSCFNKFLIERVRKKIAFCSEECLNVNRKQHEELKRNSWKYLMISLISLLVIIVYTILLLNSSEIKSGKNISNHFYLIGLLILFAGNMFFIFYDAYFNNQNTFGAFITKIKPNKNSSKFKFTYNLIDPTQIESERLSSILKYNPPFYIIVTDQTFEELLSKIKMFFEFHSEIPIESESISKIYLGSFSESLHVLFLEEKIPNYYLYMLLLFVYSPETIGYVKLDGLTFQLKNVKEKDDYIKGVSSNGEKIEIYIPDAGFKYSENNLSYCKTLTPELSQLKKLIKFEFSHDSII